MSFSPIVSFRITLKETLLEWFEITEIFMYSGFILLHYIDWLKKFPPPCQSEVKSYSNCA